MKHQAYGVGLGLLMIGLAGTGCGQKGTIAPQYKLRDPEVLDQQTASIVDKVETAAVNIPLSSPEFGVPAYPGARSIYTERMGSPEEDGEFKLVQMATPYPPEQVAAFYARQIEGEAKRQPLAQGNSAMFIWYQGPRAGQTLLIAEDGQGQTIISVGRTEMSEGNPLSLDTSTLRPEAQTTPDQRER